MAPDAVERIGRHTWRSRRVGVVIVGVAAFGVVRSGERVVVHHLRAPGNPAAQGSVERLHARRSAGAFRAPARPANDGLLGRAPRLEIRGDAPAGVRARLDRPLQRCAAARARPLRGPPRPARAPSSRSPVSCGDHAEGRPGVQAMTYEAYEEPARARLAELGRDRPRPLARGRAHRAAPPSGPPEPVRGVGARGRVGASPRRRLRGRPLRHRRSSSRPRRSGSRSTGPTEPTGRSVHTESAL